MRARGTKRAEVSTGEHDMQKGPERFWRSGPRMRRTSVSQEKPATSVAPGRGGGLSATAGTGAGAAARAPASRYPRAQRRAATAVASAQAARAAVARGTATGTSSPVWAKRVVDFAVALTGAFAAGSATV